ncbi:hypothetical protein ZIOFF_003293 [Zingiber officinale]|uniref:IST1-like protein n=1 Tax=Zingiber officinale TaxID=94328 RepID=A0A8J5HXI9_ZINOF|nr:hypothetical protein ZIOFF_003293 [Zingiber officinale]
MLIEKLSVRKPIGEVKLKVLKEIAKEYQVKWDSTELEQELLVPPERVIVCSRTLSCTHAQAHTITDTCEGPRAFADVKNVSVKPIFLKQPKDFNRKELQFKDPVSAARASSESAEKAIDGEQAASHVANQNSHPFDQPTPVDTLVCKCNKFNQVAFQKEQELDHLSGTHAPSNYEAKTLEKRPFSSQSFSLSNTLDDDSIDSADLNEKKILRRNSCISRTVYSDIKFDDSDGHESENGEQESPPSPNRPPPVLPSQQMNSLTHVHPNLSDYAALTARFEALKSHRM